MMIILCIDVFFHCLVLNAYLVIYINSGSELLDCFPRDACVFAKQLIEVQLLWFLFAFGGNCKPELML